MESFRRYRHHAAAVRALCLLLLLLYAGSRLVASRSPSPGSEDSMASTAPPASGLVPSNATLPRPVATPQHVLFGFRLPVKRSPFFLGSIDYKLPASSPPGTSPNIVLSESERIERMKATLKQRQTPDRVSTPASVPAPEQSNSADARTESASSPSLYQRTVNLYQELAQKTAEAVSRREAAPAARKPGTGPLKYVNGTVGFSVEFPIDLNVESEFVESVEDKIPSLALMRKGAWFRVEYFDTGSEVIKRDEAEKLLETLAIEIAKKQGELLESKAVTIGEGDKKAPARDFSFKQENGAVTRCRMAVVAGRYCSASTTTADNEAAARFLQSLVPTK
jgi:hypothetical protein